MCPDPYACRGPRVGDEVSFGPRLVPPYCGQGIEGSVIEHGVLSAVQCGLLRQGKQPFIAPNQLPSRYR